MIHPDVAGHDDLRARIAAALSSVICDPVGDGDLQRGSWTLTGGRLAQVVMQVVGPELDRLAGENAAFREEKAVWIRTLNDRVKALQEAQERERAMAGTLTAAQERSTADCLARRQANQERDSLLELAGRVLATVPEGVDREDWMELHVLEGVVRKLGAPGEGT